MVLPKFTDTIRVLRHPQKLVIGVRYCQHLTPIIYWGYFLHKSDRTLILLGDRYILCLFLDN
ncbi:MAG: hypothetical protein KME40_05755 [Komarekiella atlantica HA4396-MV6]|nr:hypothetical protein [Komarekiella atlantica HA4396-MV6]